MKHTGDAKKFYKDNPEMQAAARAAFTTTSDDFWTELAKELQALEGKNKALVTARQVTGK